MSDKISVWDALDLLESALDWGHGDDNPYTRFIEDRHMEAFKIIKDQIGPEPLCKFCDGKGYSDAGCCGIPGVERDVECEPCGGTGHE